jgi:hypothetical protein
LYEHLIIRPPSEARSLLVRVTRGCKWNRCLFCGIYTHLGQPDFSVRTVEEIKKDIDYLRKRVGRINRAFLGDADPLLIGVDEFAEVVEYLRQVFPELTRVTCYARASTLWKIREDGINRIARAGLDRVHVGLESGDEQVLKLHRKGQSRRILVESGRWLRRAGIEISYYVLLGLGGADRWKEHMDATAGVINEVDPEFVRLRRIWLYGDGSGSGPECPLWDEIREGRFEPQTPEGTVLELRRLIEKLEGVESFITCDHSNNYVRVEGRMPEERDRMLEEIDAFLALPEERRRAHYEAVGSQI